MYKEFEETSTHVLPLTPRSVTLGLYSVANPVTNTKALLWEGLGELNLL
jgi:hypothetical protein